jgi:glycosyltransferase involved in cell wall biosynthesis
MAHGLDVVLRAACTLREASRDDIRFLLVGDGAMRRRLEEESRRAGLENLIIFTGRLPKQEMPQVLANSDACLIHLRGCELFETVIPSKIFEILAMGRPMIMGVGGEARDIVMESGAGLTMEPDSAESLVTCLEQLTADPALPARLGSAARQYVAVNFSRDLLATRYLRLLESLANPPLTASAPELSAEARLAETPHL